MRATVCINNFNYAEYLREAIDSALGQEGEFPFEVLVVDDGSTDDSRAVIARYADRVRAILKENGGQASALNAGMQAARGEFVLFLDADDRLLPGALRRGLAAFTSDTVRVHARMATISREGRPLGFFPPPAVPIRAGDLMEDLVKFGQFQNLPTSTNLFRRSALDVIGPIPEEEYRISADFYLLAKTTPLGPVGCCEPSLAEYRLHGGNHYAGAGRRYSRQRLEGILANLRSAERLLTAIVRQHRDPTWRREVLLRNPNALQAVLLGKRLGLPSVADLPGIGGLLKRSIHPSMGRALIRRPRAALAIMGVLLASRGHLARRIDE